MTRLQIVTQLISGYVGAQAGKPFELMIATRGHRILLREHLAKFFELAEQILEEERKRPAPNIARESRVPDPSGDPLPPVEIEDEACDRFNGELARPEICVYCAHPVDAHVDEAVSSSERDRIARILAEQRLAEKGRGK